MRNFKRVFVATLLLIVGITVILFLLENRQTASLFLFGWATPELPISVFVLLALLAGLIVSPLLVYFKARSRSR